MTWEEYEANEKRMYPVNQVAKGFAYWRRHLLERCFGTFVYSGLPESLPEIEIEKRVLFGMAGIFRHPEFGIMTAWGTVTGINHYNRPTTFTWSQANAGNGTLAIGKECEIIYNDTSDETSEYQNPRGLTELINRFARMLADVDSSINIMTVAGRKTAWAVEKSPDVAKSVKAVYGRMKAGDFDVVMDEGLYDFFKVYPETTSTHALTVNDLIALKEHLLRDFMSQIGIKSAERKAERMLTDEVAADDALLDANLADMLAARKRGVERVNKMFGTNITVELGRRPNDTRNEQQPDEPEKAKEGEQNDNDNR